MAVRLTDQTHDIAQALFGFPAPWPPRAGEPRPSLFFGRTFFLRDGSPRAPLVLTEIPGTAGHSARCVPAPACASACRSAKHCR